MSLEKSSPLDRQSGVEVTRVTLWVPTELVEEVDARAKRRGVTRSELMRRVLAYGLGATRGQ